MESTRSTCGQLERELSQCIQAIFRAQLGHSPDRVICHLFSDKLVIVIEDAITQLEILLIKADRKEIVQQARSQINEVIKSELAISIEKILKIDVVGLMLDTILETGYAGIIVLLANTPKVSNPQSIPKVNKYKSKINRLENESICSF